MEDNRTPASLPHVRVRAILSAQGYSCGRRRLATVVTRRAALPVGRGQTPNDRTVFWREVIEPANRVRGLLTRVLSQLCGVRARLVSCQQVVHAPIKSKVARQVADSRPDRFANGHVLPSRDG